MAGSVIAEEAAWQSVGTHVTDLALDHRIGRRWWLALLVALALVALMAGCVAWLLYEGVGIWGNNIPVAWALDIVSYDWWIGIASGSLLVSALLLLCGAQWRGPLNRISETIAVLAAAAAGLYPIIHLGRPWFFYWTLPYPNTLLLWPQFRSPLVWDAIDIISFLLVSLSFWYVGMLPDLAAMRDRAIERAHVRAAREHGHLRLLRAQLYGIAALGWRGSAVHWARWTQTYRCIGLLGALLVVSLQTGAAVMFAGTVEPGWHDPLLPVTFLIGALFSGVAVVTVLGVLLRGVFRLGDVVTSQHLDMLARALLSLGILMLYCEATATWTTWRTGDAFARAAVIRRFLGEQAWSSWAVIALALLPVHLFWVPALRRAAPVLVVVGLLALIGLWADHYMVIVGGLQHDFLPSAAHGYAPDAWGLATFAGSVGIFAVLLLLFLRYLPAVSIVEAQRLAWQRAAVHHE